MERITETFRGVNCKRHAMQWRDRMALQGWREANFGGVGGVGGYKSCSMTLEREAPVPAPVAETHTDQTLFKAYHAILDSGLSQEWASRVINSMQNAGILFRERVTHG